jgi:hypothetical protein
MRSKLPVATPSHLLQMQDTVLQYISLKPLTRCIPAHNVLPGQCCSQACGCVLKAVPKARQQASKRIKAPSRRDHPPNPIDTSNLSINCYLGIPCQIQFDYTREKLWRCGGATGAAQGSLPPSFKTHSRAHTQVQIVFGNHAIPISISIIPSRSRATHTYQQCLHPTPTPSSSSPPAPASQPSSTTSSNPPSPSSG